MFNLYDRIMAWAGDLWGWVFIGTTLTMFLILIGFFLNWMGIGGVNFIIAVPFIMALIGLFLIPDLTVNILAAAVVSGIFQQPQTVRDEVKTFFLEYIKFVGGLIFGILLIFCFLGFIPISESPMVFFALAVLIPTVILTCIYFEIEGNWAKKLVYWSLVLLIVISIARLVPDDVYKQFIGFSPFSVFHRSKTQKTLEKVEKQLEENTDKAQVKKLEAILNNLEDDKNPSETEKADLNKIREEVNKKSLPAQTKKLGGLVIKKTADTINNAVKFYQSHPTTEKYEDDTTSSSDNENDGCVLTDSVKLFNNMGVSM